MALGKLLPGLLAVLAYSAATALALQTGMYYLNCSEQITTCNATLYHYNIGLQVDEIATYYSVSPSQIKPIRRANRQDYLISVPCSCQSTGDATGYFYETSYKVKPTDTFINVSAQVYSGQAWSVVDEEKSFMVGATVPMYLLCGCVKREAQTVVTYTVQERDTLTDIANLLSAQLSGIESLNPALLHNSRYIVVGWVLFVPMEKNGIPSPKKGLSS